MPISQAAQDRAAQELRHGPKASVDADYAELIQAVLVSISQVAQDQSVQDKTARQPFFAENIRAGANSGELDRSFLATLVEQLLNRRSTGSPESVEDA
jgi:hypothetical protein